MEAGYLDSPAPFELVLGWMSQTFHYPPDLLLEGDADVLLRTYKVLSIYEEQKSKRPKWLTQS